MRFETATRAAGLARLEAFIPRMGKRYAAGRNFDLGPERHLDVSGLSPFLRRRLVLEEEVVEAALAAHGAEGAEKFLQEVAWRGYFKGWLEHRPAIWTRYRDGLSQDLTALERDRALRRELARAEAGQTGIACFDAWAQELVETGYLHNHARMWFASIWIFTLGLPWRLGADFFYRHLLDGDPASNTLSWRWVAGLHTRGKFYEAKAWNIAKFTGQRFLPRDAELAVVTKGLEDTEPEGLPPGTPLRAPSAMAEGLPSLLLLTEEDCGLRAAELADWSLSGCLALEVSHLRSHRDVADAVAGFERAALEDAAARLGLDVQIKRAGDARDLARWAKACGARQVITGFVPRGPLRDWLDEAQLALTAEGIALCEWQRPWDAALWPHATAGFFKVKKALPRILGQRQLI
ncbi:MAG: deoxyribodipyrimidine photolyase [Rhodobacteraceae bacterium]|nr:MAG: deoxyribodipyrimidine photolyase [Paracoccaceae bacterium]